MEKLDPIKAAGVIGAKLSAELRKKIIIPQEKKGTSESVKTPSPEAFAGGDKKNKTKKIKPKSAVPLNDEKDKKIEKFFGKDTTGVITEEPWLNTKDKIKDYVNSTQSDYEREAGIKPMSFQARMEIKEEKERQEREKLPELEKKVGKARKKYAGADFETNSALAKIKKFLHISYNPNNKDEPNLKYFEYRNKLNDLFSLKVDELKSRNLGKDEIGKEMKNLVKYFDFDEKINLRNAYTESRAEAIEKKFGRVPGWIMNKSSYLLSGYGKFSKKLGFTGKTALSYALIGTGLFGAVAVNRFLGSALVAKGVIAKSEANLRERQRKTSEARALEITRQLETSDKAYDDFVNMMQQQSVGVNKSFLENERREGWKRIGKGLAAAGATFAVSKTLSHFMQDAWGPAKEHIYEFLEKIGIHNFELPFGGEKSGGHSISFLDNTEISQEGHPLHGPFNEPANENLVASELSIETISEKPIGLTVEKGSSLEGTLIKYLEESGVDHDAAGEEAHLRMLAYAEGKGIPFEKLNHILPGQEIELNSDGSVKNIPGFESAAETDAQPEVNVVPDPDNIENPEVNVVTDGATEINTPEKNEINIETDGGEVKASDVAAVGIAGTAVVAGAGFRKETKLKKLEKAKAEIGGEFKLDKMRSGFIKEINFKINKVEEEIKKFDKKIKKNPGSDDLISRKQELEKNKENLILDWYASYVNAVNRYIHGKMPGRWEEIKKRPAEEMLKDKNGNANKFYKHLLQLESGKLTKIENELKPKSKETIEKWIIRSLKVARESAIKNI